MDLQQGSQETYLNPPACVNFRYSCNTRRDAEILPGLYLEPNRYCLIQAEEPSEERMLVETIHFYKGSNTHDSHSWET